MTDTYTLLHLRGSGNTTATLEQALADEQKHWRTKGISLWGVWRGLFGLASNELLVMLAAGDASSIPDMAVTAGSIEVRSTSQFAPTVRPETTEPLVKPGIHVFRWFSIATDSVDEFVELSTQAWVSFEDAGSYSAEPQGLFREVRDSGEIEMLLVTWYDSLESWQTSRKPAASASERFRRRHQLTGSTVAVATTLL